MTEEKKPKLVRSEGQFQHKGHPPAPGLLQPDELAPEELEARRASFDAEMDRVLGPADDVITADLMGMGSFDDRELIPCPTPDFPTALLASGMVEAVCHDCGRPWLVRPKPFESLQKRRNAILFMQLPEVPKLCPLCDPGHIAYEGANGPPDRERWFNGWRARLLGAFAQRSTPALLLVPRSLWVEDVPLALYECRPRSGGEITGWHSQRLGRLPYLMGHSATPWGGRYRHSFAGGALLTGWFPAGDSIAATMEPTVQPDPKRHCVYVVPFTERPVLR